MALSHVSVPSYCPTWDGKDCPRDSHVSHPTWLCPTCPSRPIVPHGTGGTVLGTPIVPLYMALSLCPSRPIVPHGTGGTVLGTPMCPIIHGSVPCVRPVPSSHMGWVGLSWGLPSSHTTWLCPMCPSRPIVPHGMGGTVLGTPIVPHYMALSHVSVPSHRPTWDGWDCPRDSHRPTLHGSVPRVRPVPSSHMGREGLS